MYGVNLKVKNIDYIFFSFIVYSHLKDIHKNIMLFWVLNGLKGQRKAFNSLFLEISLALSSGPSILLGIISESNKHSHII